MRGGRSTRAAIAVSPAFSRSFTPGLNGSPQTGTLSSMACSNGSPLTTNSPVARALLVVSLSALQVNAMYMGSWQTRVQVPNAAALTRPCRSTVVISTRHELGAKTLSHHRGSTSIFTAFAAAGMAHALAENLRTAATNSCGAWSATSCWELTVAHSMLG